jgi:predicted NBD/HSP70 family sugar kinase
MVLLFDIGGTNTRLASAKDGGISEVALYNTPENLEDLLKLFKDFASTNTVESIVGGLAGVIKDGIVIHSPNLERWDGKDFAGEIRKYFSDARVVVKNDADLACLGEASFGAGRGHKIVTYITISTGIGGGRVVSGQIDSYRYGYEPGWQILLSEDGKSFEEIASGGMVYETVGKKYKDLLPDELNLFANKLALGIHNSIVHWSPDIVVLGGAVIHDVPELVGMLEKKVRSIMRIFPEIPVFQKAGLIDSFPTLWGALKLSESRK